MPDDKKKSAEYSFIQRAAIALIGLLMFAVVAVLTVVLAGAAIRLIQWVWP